MRGQFNKIKERLCKKCNSSLYMNGGQFANHVRYCQISEDEKNNQSENISKSMQTVHDMKLGKIKSFIVECHICHHYFTVEEREKQFPKKEIYLCNSTCRSKYANSFVDYKSQSFSDSVSKGVIDKWVNDPEYSKKCLDRNPRFTSKGERDLRDWFIETYPQEEWTFGGALKFELVSGIVRDLYSNQLKVCIEYDGIWHFEDILGQLESKQIKDKALEAWCIENEFRLIRVKDDIYQIDPEHWKIKIRDEVMNGTVQIVKFY